MPSRRPRRRVRRRNPYPARTRRMGQAFDRCVRKVGRSGRVSNAYAVCTTTFQRAYGKRKVRAMRKSVRRNPSGTTTARRVMDGIVRAYWADIWLSEQEEKAERTGRPYPWPPGSQLLDYVPKRVPESVRLRAAYFAHKLKIKNRATLDGLYRQAMRAPGRHLDRHTRPFDFGFDIAMEGMGHGVSWFDSHPRFPIDIPWVEAHR
jgi:hypothetical protein